MVSSIRYRRPAGSSSVISTDLLTSPANVSSAMSTGRPSPQHTRSTPARSNEPANTDARSHSNRSGLAHRSKLHSTAACTVWWRGVPTRPARQRRDRWHQVLAGVHHQQHLPGGDELVQDLHLVASGLVDNPQRVGHHLRYQQTIVHTTELDQPRPVGERASHGVGYP